MHRTEGTRFQILDSRLARLARLQIADGALRTRLQIADSRLQISDLFFRRSCGDDRLYKNGDELIALFAELLRGNLRAKQTVHQT